MTSEQVAALARECVTLVKSRAVDAVRYCEAYEGTDQCIVFDGSAYGPSMRVLPRAEEVWEAVLSPAAFIAQHGGTLQGGEIGVEFRYYAPRNASGFAAHIGLETTVFSADGSVAWSQDWG
jgi:hypothetical protein